MPQKRKLDDVANNPELTRLANQIFEPKRTDGGFAARSIVCLGGLVSAPELNGRMALVVKEMDSGGRMTVTLSGEMNPVPFGGRADTRRVLRVAPKNVRRVPISLGHCPLSFRMRTSTTPGVRNISQEASDFKDETMGGVWMMLIAKCRAENPPAQDEDAIGVLEGAGLHKTLEAFLTRGDASRLARTTWARADRRDKEARQGQMAFLQAASEAPEEASFGCKETIESVLARGAPLIAMHEALQFISACIVSLKSGKLTRRDMADSGTLKAVCALGREWAAFGPVVYYVIAFMFLVFDRSEGDQVYAGDELDSGAWQTLVAIMLAQGGAGGDASICAQALIAASQMLLTGQDPYDFGAAGGLAGLHAIVTCKDVPPVLASQARQIVGSMYGMGFQPILPYRGERYFSHVDAGAPARRLDFFRRFEAGEITVAYSTEWHRLVNLPETESEDEASEASDDDGVSEASSADEADASVNDDEEEIDGLLEEPSEEDIQGVTRASLGLDSKLVASAGLLFALVAAGAWDLGAARATGFAAVVTAIAWVFVL